MQGIIYTRVSSEEQVSGTSLDSQEEACRKYCKENNIEVVAVFREEGASAKSAHRKQFIRAIERCRKAHKAKQPIDAFVVAKIDRFARNTEDHFSVRKILIDFGTKLHSVSEPIGDEPAAKLFETILAGFSELDNTIRRERCIEGQKARYNQGIYPHRPPVGYSCAYSNKQRKKKTEPDQPDPETFYILKQALGEFADGVCARGQLRYRLDELGLSLVRGKETYKQFVDQILSPRRLKYYAGILENPWTKKDVQGLHRPILSTITYQKIVERLEGSKKKPRWKSVLPDFPLRRLVRCASCDRNYHAAYSTGRGGKYAYYKCSNKGCTYYGKSIRRDDIEGQFVTLLDSISVSPRHLGLLEATATKHFEDQADEAKAAQESVNRATSALQARKRQVYTMAEEGLYTGEEVKERIAEIDLRIEHLKQSRAARSTRGVFAPTLVSKILKFHSALGAQWRRLPLPSQERLQGFVFPEGLSYHKDTGYRTPQTPYLFSLISPFQAPETILVHQGSLRNNDLEVCPAELAEKLKTWIEVVLEAIDYLEKNQGDEAMAA